MNNNDGLMMFEVIFIIVTVLICAGVVMIALNRIGSAANLRRRKRGNFGVISSGRHSDRDHQKESIDRSDFADAKEDQAPPSCVTGQPGLEDSFAPVERESACRG
jgi:hypothetical protein